ncbi:unnamed protein product [Periconia digitata]|uniref:non-specific serine/threonine protein kinase n=1 Tax=Periconia digitata TaxID=1303443 RepID=A0A9W4USE9_9PLEO|nr:unnamed protein product [Periconia digitata]
MKNSVPTSQIEILNQLIDDEQGTYRVRAGHRVHYVTIPTSTFDEDTMCRTYLLIPQLPAFPDEDWTTMHISRGIDGVIESILSHKPLPEIHEPWHHRRIDVLSLKRTKRHRSNVHEVSYEDRPAIAKIALFEWDFQRIENETIIYSIINKHQHQHPAEPPCAPEFLGHLTENDRVIGFLLEKVDGEFASIENVSDCQNVLHRLHGMGLIHGDVNRYNFIVDQSHKTVRMIDFEHAEEFDETRARQELESLASELTENTGRGGPTVSIN